MIRLVAVVPYDPGWVEQYRDEAVAVTETLAQASAEIVAIHHIGSTAVPGLCAKPTIDLLAVISAAAWQEEHTRALERLSYIAKGEHGIPGRRFFIKPREELRTHHLHIFPDGHPQISRHLAFRDYLRAFPDVARRYGRLKTSLAAAFPCDIHAYMDGKAGIIRAIENEALDWAAGRGAGTEAALD